MEHYRFVMKPFKQTPGYTKDGITHLIKSTGSKALTIRAIGTKNGFNPQKVLFLKASG